MSKAETGIRSRNLFDPNSEKPFKLSRSKIDRFAQCPRCFYLDRRLGIDRPDLPGWTLNSAVDTLLKAEFDVYRERGVPHPLMRSSGIDAVPFAHPELDDWRQNFKGVRYHHAPTNLIISGAVDDVWVDPAGHLIVVDYKATSTKNEISFASGNRQQYKRQVEIYQWLLRANSHPVSDMAYFVYANGHRDRPGFDARLEFDVRIYPYLGDASWVEGCIIRAHACLVADEAPEPAPRCSYCLYRQAARRVEAF